MSKSTFVQIPEEAYSAFKKLIELGPIRIRQLANALSETGPTLDSVSFRALSASKKLGDISLSEDIEVILRDVGTDHQNGVSFDQQHGSALGDRIGHDAISAYAGVARHVAKSAESSRTRNWVWQSLERTGRQAFVLVQSGVVDRATANSSLRTAAGHKQDDQTAKTKPPAGSCSRILDQSLEPTRVRSSRNRPLE
jgi:hypothetical protein